MDSYRVQSINCNSFDHYILWIGILTGIHQIIDKLMVMIRELTLDMENKTDQALEKLLLRLKILSFQNANHFICNEIKTIQKDIIWTINNNF